MTSEIIVFSAQVVELGKKLFTSPLTSPPYGGDRNVRLRNLIDRGTMLETPEIALESNTPSGIRHVISFPVRAIGPNRLTATDRQEAFWWVGGAAAMCCEIVVTSDVDAEIGDFISVYKVGQAWATWGIGRRGNAVLLWRADRGIDLGTFDSVREALAGIITHR